MPSLKFCAVASLLSALISQAYGLPQTQNGAVGLAARKDGEFAVRKVQVVDQQLPSTWVAVSFEVSDPATPETNGSCVIRTPRTNGVLAKAGLTCRPATYAAQIANASTWNTTSITVNFQHNVKNTPGRKVDTRSASMTLRAGNELECHDDVGASSSHFTACLRLNEMTAPIIDVVQAVSGARGD